ncbi:hypothetical protein ACFX12_014903 [Malus domestica]
MASPPQSKRRRKNQSKDEADDPSAAPSSTPEKLSPVVVFAHGAGAPSSSDWMIRFLFNFFASFGNIRKIFR